jgi:hypothetical protein
LRCRTQVIASITPLIAPVMMLRLLAALLLLYGEVRAETPAEKAGFAPAARVSKYEVWSDVVALDAALASCPANTPQWPSATSSNLNAAPAIPATFHSSRKSGGVSRWDRRSAAFCTRAISSAPRATSPRPSSRWRP